MNLKKFSLQSRRLPESFEGLNSFLAQSPSELWSCYKTLETKVHANCPGSKGVNTCTTLPANI